MTTAQVAIRFDRDVLSVFRAAGPGWQTRMNEALRDWLRTHIDFEALQAKFARAYAPGDVFHFGAGPSA